MPAGWSTPKWSAVNGAVATKATSEPASMRATQRRPTPPASASANAAANDSWNDGS